MGSVARFSESIQERFWSYVEITDGCWIWTGAKTKGYGKLRIDQSTWMQAHRLAYEIIVGEIPEGLELDHSCRNHSCVNPDHLEPVTTRVNTLRGEGLAAINARKKRCKHGHPLSGANVYTHREKNATHRKCRACMRRRQQELKGRFAGPRRPKPSKETLAREIETHTFVALGEHYGVTDTTIRNWAKKYGLTWVKHAR